MKILIIVIAACLLFASCGVKNNPEYKSQLNRANILSLV